MIGYSLKFAGAMGNSWINIGLFGIFGLALYAVFCLSAHFMQRWNKFAATLFFPALWLLAYLIATLLRFPALVRVDMMLTDMNTLMHAERLIGSLGFSFAIINRDAQPLASIGAAFGQNQDIDALIKEAESQMYIEKKAFYEHFPEAAR